MVPCISRLMCIAFVVLACAHLGTSLKCYLCNSTFNGDCDAVRGKTLPEENCDQSKLLNAFPKVGSNHVCVVHRQIQKVDRSLNIARGCAPDQYCSHFPDSTQCTTCDSDLCNSSSAILPFFVLSIVGIICAKLLF